MTHEERKAHRAKCTNRRQLVQFRRACRELQAYGGKWEERRYSTTSLLYFWLELPVFGIRAVVNDQGPLSFWWFDEVGVDHTQGTGTERHVGLCLLEVSKLVLRHLRERADDAARRLMA
jgi:hypothetical protein